MEAFFRAGGPWYVTDMRRGESIFELDMNAQEEFERGFEVEGSNLSGVSARCSWAEQDTSTLPHLKDGNDCEDETNPKQGLQESAELMHIKKLDGVHLVFNLEAGSLLPLAIR